MAEQTDHHVLDVILADGQLTDVRLDGESQYPTWFKVEWKESGEVSAKIKGIRLGTRFGDVINIHQTSSGERGGTGEVSGTSVAP
jgi:hypothetical protein